MVTIKFNENDLQKDLQKFRDIFGESVAEQGQSIINRFANECMIQYYGEYPEYEHVIYKPQTNMMLLDSYKKIKKGSGETAAGGVKIDSGYTKHPDTPHPLHSGTWTEEDIYSEVWDKGYHGWMLQTNAGKSMTKNGYTEGYYVRIGSGTDFFDLLEKKSYADSVKNNVAASALEKAKSGSYSVIRFS